MLQSVMEITSMTKKRKDAMLDSGSARTKNILRGMLRLYLCCVYRILLEPRLLRLSDGHSAEERDVLLRRSNGIRAAPDRLGRLPSDLLFREERDGSHAIGYLEHCTRKHSICILV